ncbi:hypothetical protein Thi970DRAFT_00264 [Thiorhodovibrio frisius]|uniref:Uncharacterized protein n=1 Tax=Thiorhodovibrio frisius TaxID=631362 RepID=H8YVW6_9GAMM|nr:hypothetical protein Thi970DRAFT_00264 [Thiorhodovibrio frisius]WPL20168.1 hypothetical protein Thiofri_00232 [Thiorhodovibrio frisius]
MIRELLWPEDRVDHIARHDVSPEEFEEVCFGCSLVLRTKSTGVNPVYHGGENDDAFTTDRFSVRTGRFLANS